VSTVFGTTQYSSRHSSLRTQTEHVIDPHDASFGRRVTVVTPKNPQDPWHLVYFALNDLEGPKVVPIGMSWRIRAGEAIGEVRQKLAETVSNMERAIFVDFEDLLGSGLQKLVSILLI
jgi:hypothetical protein